MKVLQINTGWLVQNHYISDHAKADAAYAAIKDALDTWDRYGNDKQKSVSLDLGDGVATFKVEALVSVSLEDCSAAEAGIIEREVWKRSLDAKVSARLAPSA